MKIIQRYIIREHLGPLFFALSALTSIMLLNYISRQLGNLLGKGLEWTVIVEFLLLSIPFTVAMTLPMAVLVAVLYAFSRLASENEITALKANGVSMGRLMRPVLVGGVLLAIVMVIFNDQVLPRANHRLRALQSDIARKKPSFALRPQIINEVVPQGGFYLRAFHIDPNTNKLRDVTIYDLADQMRRHTIYADSGQMAFTPDGRDLKLTLYHGFIQEVPRDKPEQMQRVHYDVDVIRVANVANSFTRDTADYFKTDREMSVCELQREVARYEGDFFQARARYDTALAALGRNPKAVVPLFNSTVAVQQESKRKTLGAYYCKGLRYLEQRGLTGLTGTAWNGVRNILLPPAALAQQPQDSARRDSAVKADTGRPSVATPSTTVQQTPARVDSLPTLPPPPVPLPETAAQATATIPAQAEMEQTRAIMLSNRQSINAYEVEIHKKFAISIACIVFVLLGAPLALRFPRGGVGLVIGVSLVVFALYYVGLIAGESLADKNILGPAMSMWAANALFAAVGLILTLRMNRDGASNRGGGFSETLDRLLGRLLRRGGHK